MASLLIHWYEALLPIRPDFPISLCVVFLPLYLSKDGSFRPKRVVGNIRNRGQPLTIDIYCFRAAFRSVCVMVVMRLFSRESRVCRSRRRCN